MWANSLSHNGLTGCGRNYFMAVHQLEHEVSGMFDHVAHGAGLAVLWPAWAKYSYKAARELFKRFAYEVMEIAPTSDLCCRSPTCGSRPTAAWACAAATISRQPRSRT